MTYTTISSAHQKVTLGFDKPFVVIGERINPTGRKLLAAEMAAGDFSRVEADAVAQVCLLYTSPSPRDRTRSRMPSSA